MLRVIIYNCELHDIYKLYIYICMYILKLVEFCTI